MESIARGDVICEDVVRVCGKICLMNNDNITFKEVVVLMARQQQWVGGLSNVNSVRWYDFVIVMRCNSVRESELTKVKKPMETCEWNSKKQFFVMVGSWMQLRQNSDKVICW